MDKATYQTKTNPDKYKTLFLTPCKSSLSDSSRFLSLSISVAHSCRMLAFACPCIFLLFQAVIAIFRWIVFPYSFTQWNSISKLRNLTDWLPVRWFTIAKGLEPTDYSDLKSTNGKRRPKSFTEKIRRNATKSRIIAVQIILLCCFCSGMIKEFT